MFNLKKDVREITLSVFELNGQSLYTVRVWGRGVGYCILDKTFAFNRNQENFLVSKSKERKMRENGLHTYLIERGCYLHRGNFYPAKTQVQDNYCLYPEEICYLLLDFFEDEDI